MKKEMKKSKYLLSIVLLIVTVLTICITLAACGDDEVKLDYDDIIAFETALNNGENVSW